MVMYFSFDLHRKYKRKGFLDSISKIEWNSNNHLDTFDRLVWLAGRYAAIGCVVDVAAAAVEGGQMKSLIAADNVFSPPQVQTPQL